MTGTGVVRLKTGDSFQGRYEIAGGWVKFTGRLVTYTLGEPLYRSEVTRIWPRRQVVAIRDGAA